MSSLYSTQKIVFLTEYFEIYFPLKSLKHITLNDTYKTIKSPSEGLFKDKGSKFLAFVYPFENENELKKYLEPLRKEHFKAVHFCYAYRLGMDKTHFRINDDGEPSGSAGRPILNVLLSKEITNVLVVVVRYWGGTLLGVPGLINAYKSATEEAILSVEIIEKTVNEVYRITFAYVQMNDVMKVVKDFDLKIRNQQFDNQCVMEIEFRQSIAPQVLGKLEKIEEVLVEFIKVI
ncbi:MAG: YigZ family protein [Arcicella sp.]|nr:YigZ family protein [Arcicella sp.]